MTDFDKEIQRFIDANVGQRRLSAAQRAWVADIVQQTYYTPIITEQLNMADWQTAVDNYYATQIQPGLTAEPDHSDYQLAVAFFYQWVGQLAKTAFGQPALRVRYCQAGIDTLAPCQVTAAVVRAEILRLYENAGVTQRQLGDLAGELKTSQAGLAYAQPFLAEETDSSVREAILRLYQNAGVTQGQLGDLAGELKTSQAGLAYAQPFLAEETDSSVREAILTLYQNAGVTQGQLGDLAGELKTSQAGLAYAQRCLAQGESDLEAWDSLLTIFMDYTATLADLNQQSQLTTALAPLGLWTWVMAGKLSNKQNWSILLHNWAKRLQSDRATPALFEGFQQLLTDLTQHWHHPHRSHRLFAFLPTTALLSIAESLYLLEQALAKQPLQYVYASLQQVADSPELEQAYRCQALFAQQDDYQQKQAELETLVCPSIWNFRQRAARQHYQQLQQEINDYKQQYDDYETLHLSDNWQKRVKKTINQLDKWLKHHFKQRFSFLKNDIDHPHHALLAILFIQQPNALQDWQQTPPWHEAKVLINALTHTAWQQWLSNETPDFYLWLLLMRTTQIAKQPLFSRLQISQQLRDFEQPELTKQLQQLKQGNFKSLSSSLDATWTLLQQQARELTDALSVIDDESAEQRYANLLTALILGDLQLGVHQKIADWWQRQAPIQIDKNEYVDDVLTTYAALQQRFNALTEVYDTVYPHSALFVEQWAEVYAQELLQAKPIKTEELWLALERTRISLSSIRFKLDEDWETEVTKKLWGIINRSIQNIQYKTVEEQSNLFESRYAETMWPPIQYWLDTFIRPKPPTAADCQTALAPDQAIIQPFFDANQTLRLLWLDSQRLEIRDFSEAEYSQRQIWHERVKQWQAPEQAAWQAVLTDPALNHIADELKRWASQGNIQHLIAIFPTPLGLLAWEALPQLANLLSREISIDHWLHCPDEPAEEEAWVLGVTDREDISRSANLIPVESYLVAKHWHTQPQLVKENPSLSLFQALQQLQQHRRIYISTHGVFNADQPLTSGLSLFNYQEKSKKTIDLPLWVCDAVQLDHCQLLILSACETAAGVEDNQNLFDPVNIAASLAASGVNTVIATLSRVDNFPSLIFIDELLTLAAEQPTTPWHHLISQTRERFQHKTETDRETLKSKIKELLPKEEQNLTLLIPRTLPDMTAAKHWANFIVIGKVDR